MRRKLYFKVNHEKTQSLCVWFFFACASLNKFILIIELIYSNTHRGIEVFLSHITLVERLPKDLIAQLINFNQKS